jgi:murein DD-endopeptidase MepM/ murein hydrolase activator NlpD
MRGRSRGLYLLCAAAALASCEPASTAPAGRARHDVQLGADQTVVDGVVPENATLDSLLREQLSPDLAASIVRAARGVFDPRDLHPEQPYRITRTVGGLFREFRYAVDPDTLLRVVFHNSAGDAAASYDADLVSLPKEYVLDASAAGISPAHSTLVSAFDAAGETIQLPQAIADVFSGVVDFNSDLQIGDRVQVLFERARRDGEFIGYGAVHAAILQASRRRIVAIRYPGADGQPGWYDEHGRSLRRSFLKSPLPFTPHVTSAFSYTRLHPLYGTVRPHLGVDYGAPYGTPVRAVAAGTVEAAAWEGDAGRMVKLRHTGGYETAYLHLSSFAPRVHAGTYVDQGQVVGWVGTTGASTGSHLDYRIIRNGVYVNPLVELSRLPAEQTIAADRMPDFARERDRLLADLYRRLALAEPAVETRAAP